MAFVSSSSHLSHQHLRYNQTSDKNDSFKPPVTPYDVKFHRGQAGKTGPSGNSVNVFQEQMAAKIKDYQQGKINVNQFRTELREKNIPVDAEMDRLIRRQEAGDFVSQSDFGKKIYREMNGTEVYNRPEKVNMNDNKIVSPEKTGKNHFAIGQDVKQPVSRKIDNHHIDQQARHLGAIYQQKKG